MLSKPSFNFFSLLTTLTLGPFKAPDQNASEGLLRSKYLSDLVALQVASGSDLRLQRRDLPGPAPSIKGKATNNLKSYI